LGKFIVKLNSDRKQLPDNIKQKVHELTDAVKSDEEKVKILYNYLQQNTRYILITLGIGGWQPLPASFVAEKKYGDCKALSNFMVCLLKEANINAHYTVIKCNESNINNGLYDDFPMSNFNHIVTCVPMQKDTIWLECTSKTESAGYMGTFTGNRKALAITDAGGAIVSTPMFKPNENYQLRKALATIDDKGNLETTTKTVFTGIEQELVHNLLHYKNDDDIKKHLNKVFDLPTYTVHKFNYQENKGKTPSIVETLDITSPDYAAISGKRMFIVPNLFEKQFKLENDKPRRFEIVYTKAFTDIDSIEIKIPAGYAVEMMPKNIDINNKFGKYKMTYSFDNNVIKNIRHYEHNTNTFPPKDYEEFVTFYEEMYKADRAKMVLIKM
jgi:hypothetical protein